MRKHIRTIALLLAFIMVFTITMIGLVDGKDSFAAKREPAISANGFQETNSIQVAVNALEGPVSTASTKITTNENRDTHYPTIIIPGMGQSDVYRLDENGNRIKGDSGRSLMNFNPEPLNSLVNPMLSVLLTQKKQRFIEELSFAISEGIKTNYISKEGVMLNDIEVVRHNQSLKKISWGDKNAIYGRVPLQDYTKIVGEDHLYFFAYNPLGEPYVTAAELDEYIQMVLEQTGCDKVNLVALSLGGTILTAYLDDYADKGQVAKIINVVAALNGSKIVSTLFSGNYEFSDQMLYSDLFPHFFEGANGYIANILLRLFPKKVLERSLEEILNQMLDKVLLNSPSIWALVPYEDYDALANKHLNGTESAVLREKTDRYHAAQGNFAQTTKRLAETGVEIYNLTAYGLDFASKQSNYPFFGLIKFDDTVNSDALIQASSTSMGATFAPVGKTLGSGYIQKNTNCTNLSHNHSSPDNAVDASTAVFPDQTWFFANQHHDLDRNDVAIALIVELLVCNEPMTVYSDARFPQFNGARDTKRILNELLPKAKAALWELNDTMKEEDKAELNAAIAQADAIFKTTIATPQPAIDCEKRLEEILLRIGVLKVEDKDNITILAEIMSKLISDTLFKYYGAKGFLDWIKL